MTTPTPSITAMSESPWKHSGEHRRLARALAREVVTEVAAGELPLFEQRARSHFRPRLWSRRPLSVDVFGLAAEVVTPAALSAAAGVIGVMSAELVSRLTSRVVGRVSRRWRRSEAEPAGPADAAPAPTAAELARWRTAALSGALRHVSEQRAQQVADSVLAELVRMLATDGAPEHSSSPPTVLQSSGASGSGGPNADDADDADRHAEGAPGNPSGDTEHVAGHRDPDGDGPAATRL